MSESVHIWHNNFIDVPITIKISEYGYALGVKGQGQLFLKSVLILETRELFFHFLRKGVQISDGGYSYLIHYEGHLESS